MKPAFTGNLLPVGLQPGAVLGNGRRLGPLCPSVSRLSAPCCGDATAVSGLTGRPVSEIWRVGVMEKVWLIWLMSTSW